MDKRQQLTLQRGAAGNVAVPEAGADLDGLPGQNIGKDGNDTAAAHRKNGNDLVVVSGVNIQLIADKGRCGHDAGNVSVGLLDGGDIRVLGQLLIGGGLDIYTRAGRDIIDDDGLGGGVCDGGVHLYKAILRCLIIVRRDNEHGVAANFAGVLCQGNGIGGVVGAGAGDDRHAALGMPDAEGKHLAVLLVGEGGALAGCAGNYERMDALGNLPVDKTAQRVIIDAGFGQRGNKRGGNAAEDGVGSHDIQSPSQKLIPATAI